MTRYYVGTEQECTEADAIISVNCGWPSGETLRWAEPRQLEDGRYAIEVPTGSHGFTAEQMQNGATLMPVEENVQFMVSEQ